MDRQHRQRLREKGTSIKSEKAQGLEENQVNPGIGTVSPNEGQVEVKGGSVCVDTNSDDTASSCIASESDVRLKTNIINITGALEKIKQLRGVSFDWRVNDAEVLSHYPLIARFNNSPHSVGLIAQEVAGVLPEAIMQETVGDNQTQYLQLDYDKFVPLLVEGVKELKAENDDLRKELRDLRSELAVMHPRLPKAA